MSHRQGGKDCGETEKNPHQAPLSNGVMV